jgi:pimeloyl-ACP methyl ester carboxylesterase
MFEGFVVRDMDVAGARIHLRHGGNGPPLLLLHGNPLTHVMWHKIAPRLAQHYTVVAADLRGYGDSSKPPNDDAHMNYSFRSMARDNVEVMNKLGFDRWYVAGHDRGGRVAHRMALDFPQHVMKVAFLDIVPTLHMLSSIPLKWAVDSYHWFFMAQPYDYPEKMIEAYGFERYIRKKQRREHPRRMRGLSRRGLHRPRARPRRPLTQDRDADAGAVGREEPREPQLQADRGVAGARLRRPREDGAVRTLSRGAGAGRDV